VLATVKAVKPTQGWNSNSYIVFDYQSQTNFKFAGIDASTNKLVIGHRNASGWIIDSQASFQGGVKSDTWYNLLLSINGLTATLIVNGTTTFSFTFQPTVVDGWSYGLNWGLVGFGSNNSRGELDDIAVQIVPVTETVSKSDDFASGPGPMFNGSSTGSWSAALGRYIGTPAAPADTAINLMNLGGVAQMATTSILTLSTVVKTSGRAGFVFDRYSDTDFKFAAIDVVTKQVMIGHRTNSGWFIDAAITNTSLNATTDYTLGVSLKGSTVSVTLNGQVAVGFSFNGVAVDGRFGLFTRGASASFDSVMVKTNDPSVPQALTAAAAATSSTSTEAGSLTVEQVDAILDAAIGVWSTVLASESDILRLRQVRIQIVDDLPVSALALESDGTIVLDSSAAGYGWFVDPTPLDDSEFRATAGSELEAGIASPAYGHMDLLTALVHELGHVLGLGHSETGDVMNESLTTGVRSLDLDVAPPTVETVGPAFEPEIVNKTRSLRMYSAGFPEFVNPDRIRNESSDQLFGRRKKIWQDAVEPIDWEIVESHATFEMTNKEI
jgi:hypothetical protein